MWDAAERPGAAHPQGAYQTRSVRVLVAGRDAAGDGESDGTAKVWDAASGRELLTLRGHTGWVRFRVLVAGRDAAGDRE